MRKMLSVIFMNFLGYDLIIFIAAVITGIMYYKLRESADRLYNKMHLTVFVPDGGASRREAEDDIQVLRETDIVTMRNHTGKLYSMFVNLTGIFPLLGILGTVVSLLGMVSDSTDITGNFYGALTSTFWGLVFAIIFKFLDGVVSAKIEDNEKTVALYLDRNDTHGPMKNETVSIERPVTKKEKAPAEVLVPAASEEQPETIERGTVSEIIIRDKDSIDELLKALDLGDDK